MFDTLNEKTIHQQCIDCLLIEVYKFLNGYSPDIMNDVFHLRQNTYNLRNFHAFATAVPRNNCTLNSVAYRANQLWETLPWLEKLMLSRIIQKRIKKLALHWMPCQICSRFIADGWIHLIFDTSILFRRILLAVFFI